MISSLSFQSCQEATAPTHKLKSKLDLNKNKSGKLTLSELDILAKEIALLLNNDNVKEVLKNTLQHTTTREFILDAKEFLFKKIILNNQQTSLKQELLNNTIERNKLSNILDKLKKGKIDIYFPVFQHFINWYDNKNELRVGYMNPLKEWSPVNAYKLNGEHILLDANKPPQEPVLMVNYCEHFGNHTTDIKINKNKSLKKTDFNPEFLEKVRIKPGKCQEPWGSGVPEIIVEIKNRDGVAIQYLEMQSGGDSFFNCGCCGFLCLDMCHDYNWKSPSNFFAYVWTPDEYYYIWDWWENDDIGDDWNHEYNYVVDDDLGLATVYKSDSYNKMYDTGYMQFYVTNQP